jgi:ArsR family transcriptional regulator
MDELRHLHPLDPARFAAAAASAAALLKSIGNEHRLMILCRLLEGECSVGALATSIDLSQSALSQHLAKLRAEGLVATRRDAQVIHYRLASAPVMRVLETLAGIFCPPIESKG